MCLGLKNIFIFSLLSGISFGISYRASGGVSQIGLGPIFFDSLSQYLDSSTLTILTIISAVITVFFIFKLASFFREIYEQQSVGAIISALAFAGSLIVVFGSFQNMTFVLVGVGCWIISGTIVLKSKIK